MAQLGWIAGPLAMVLFASVTLISTYLLCNCYKTPDPEVGPVRNRSYIDAVNMNLGKTNARVCGLFVQVGLYGMGIAYTITSAISLSSPKDAAVAAYVTPTLHFLEVPMFDPHIRCMYRHEGMVLVANAYFTCECRAIQKSNCYHNEGHNAECYFGDAQYMLAFGVVQLILSQINNFHNIQWLSVVAAFMSFAYSIVGLGLGIAKVVGNGYIKGSIRGISTSTTGEKVWLVSQALGDIAFAYPYSLILIEIQDTLKSPPSEKDTMKTASIISISATTFFYLCCGALGYAAFGDKTPGNLLTGFGFYEPYWLIDFANMCIVLHLVGGYQVYSQPLFANVEKWVSVKFPDSGIIHKDFKLKLPLLPAFKLNVLRLCFRTIFVASTTIIAMLFPYFNQVLGVLGGIYFWPLSIYFPVQMYFKQRNVEAWSLKWVMLQSFSLVCLPLTLFALVGSIEGLITARLK
ncbi:hypothetical protein Gotri_001180 [Gossypium trilobum]|uniref:Amino acid transporter transmembrane domain-containing protein n=1 Tax=Gossypium trilobum TaxID=34281 RepID=A0A7J9FE57_9ROSI|nr:hypothetical protein [Gossypium trilobum]